MSPQCDGDMPSCSSWRGGDMSSCSSRCGGGMSPCSSGCGGDTLHGVVVTCHPVLHGAVEHVLQGVVKYCNDYVTPLKCQLPLQWLGYLYT